jgi:hydrogenase maturation protein HypF
LPGGAAAIKRPYRIAIGYILALLGEDVLNSVIAGAAKQSPGAPLGQVAEVEMEIIKRQIERKMNSPLNSSMGRLFDAVSALLGIRGEIDYEGQAAVELEMAAYSSVVAGSGSDEAISLEGSYPYRIVENEGIRIVYLKDLLSAVLEDLRHGIPRERISARFHEAVARLINEMCRLIAGETGIARVALSGGVFQNRLLFKRTVGLLEGSDFQVLTHSQVPCNDGGVSLGQAVIANFAA